LRFGLLWAVNANRRSGVSHTNARRPIGASTGSDSMLVIVRSLLTLSFGLAYPSRERAVA
jgi:hypothetical protein